MTIKATVPYEHKAVRVDERNTWKLKSPEGRQYHTSDLEKFKVKHAVDDSWEVSAQ